MRVGDARCRDDFAAVVGLVIQHDEWSPHCISPCL
jgi:hypothetical protein